MGVLKNPLIFWRKKMLVCIFGMRGSGKTNTIKGNLENFRGPVVNLDLLGNYPDPEYIQTNSISEMIKNISYYIKQENKSDLQKIIVLQTQNPDEAIDYASAALWEAGGGTLVIDEADGFNDTNAPCFDQLIRYGRNRNVDLITGCRRPYEISRNITAGANKIYIFRTNEPRDIEYFKSTVLGEKAEKLRSLPKYHGVYVDYDTETTGIFKTDENGTIYRLSSEKISDNMEVSNLENQNDISDEPENHNKNLKQGENNEHQRDFSSNGGVSSDNRGRNSRRAASQSSRTIKRGKRVNSRKTTNNDPV